MQKIAKILVFCAFSLVCGNSAIAQEAGESETTGTESAVTETAAAEATAETASEVASSSEGAETASSEGAETASSDSASGDGSETASGETSPSGSETAASNESQTVEVLTDALIDKRLHEVSTNLDTLKEDTFTTKSRLLLLREEVLQRSVSGSRIVIRHKNDMGGQYDMVQVYYAMDREPVFSKQDASGELNGLDDEVIYDRVLAPGAHQLQVLYLYKGKPWGVFRYMKDYTFRVESGYDFIIEEGKAAELVVTASEQGPHFAPYEDRPSVKFDYQQYDLIPGNPDEAETAAAGN